MPRTIRLQNTVRPDTVRQSVIAAAGLVLLIGFSQPVNAEDWMFRRSYYSHQLPDGMLPHYPVPESRSAYRTAYYRYGFGVSTGYRINNFVIQNGARVDRTITQEGWIEFNPPAD